MPMLPGQINAPISIALWAARLEFRSLSKALPYVTVLFTPPESSVNLRASQACEVRLWAIRFRARVVASVAGTRIRSAHLIDTAKIPLHYLGSQAIVRANWMIEVFSLHSSRNGLSSHSPHSIGLVCNSATEIPSGNCHCNTLQACHHFISPNTCATKWHNILQILIGIKDLNCALGKSSWKKGFCAQENLTKCIDATDLLVQPCTFLPKLAPNNHSHTHNCSTTAASEWQRKAHVSPIRRCGVRGKVGLATCKRSV